MRQILIAFFLIKSLVVLGQEPDDKQLFWSNPYFIESDTSFTLDTIPNSIKGQVVDYAKNPFPLAFVRLRNSTGSETIYYCDSEGKFYIPRSELDNSIAYVKIGCCVSDSTRIEKPVESIEIKFQGGLDCLREKNIKNCNPIRPDEYYVNYMLEDVLHYDIQLGQDILSKDSIEVMFYTRIDPERIYRNDLDKQFLGADLIKLKYLPFEEWKNNLFTKE